MLRFCAILVLMLSPALSHAAYIDTSKVLSDLASWGSSLGIDDYSAALDAVKIDQHTWAATYHKLIPDVTKLAKIIRLEIAVYQRFINELQNQDKDPNAKYVYVPDVAFNLLLNNLKKVQVCLTNTLTTNLQKKFVENFKIFESKNGVVTVPQSLESDILSTLNYIAQQFGCVQDAAGGLSEGFAAIGQAIKLNANDVAPRIYQQIADTAKPCAVKLGGIGLHLVDFINAVNKISTPDTHGNFVISAASLAKATDTAVDRISSDFHILAVYIKIFVKNAINIVKGTILN